MRRYHVFLNAPTARELSSGNSDEGRKWHVVDCEQPFSETSQSANHASRRKSLMPTTLEAASRRISMIYENMIFQETPSDEEQYSDDDEDVAGGKAVAESQEPTTFITWRATTLGDQTRFDESANQSVRNTTFLRASQSMFRPHEETQETTFSYSQHTGGDSDASVIRFPSFHFSLHTLSSLAALSHMPSPSSPPRVSYPFSSGKRKANLLVAVLELDGPETITLKKGRDAGKEVALLKAVVGDPEGGVCRLTAWRETAAHWGGVHSQSDAPSLKTGDVVYLSNVLVSKDAAPPTAHTPPLALTASPALGSAMTVCYRTMPCGDPADEKLRPDLRLGLSDGAVRKVAAVVEWFEESAGLVV